MIEIFDFEYPGLLLLFKWFTLETHSLTDLISHQIAALSMTICQRTRISTNFLEKQGIKIISTSETHLSSFNKNNMTNKSIKWNQFAVLLFPRNHLS